MTVKNSLILTNVAYGVTLAVFVFLEMTNQKFYSTILKPFIVWCYTAFFGVMAFRFKELKTTSLYLAGVFFMYGTGDVVMEFGKDLTPVGMLMFFVGHVFYIMAMFAVHDAETEKDLPTAFEPKTRKIIAYASAITIFVVTSIAVFFVARASHLYLFCFMAEVYAQLFSTAAFIGAMKWYRPSSIMFTAVGSFIYAISDICIATQRFIVSASWMPYFVIVTYWSSCVIYACAFFPVFLHAGEKAEKDKPKEKEQ